MRRRAGARCWIRPRDAIIVLTLVSQLIVTLGFPMPVYPAAKTMDGKPPFPCQDRPCGCQTYDECWKGDCCCFTLEEKLAWAEDNGVEPPPHVRPLVASRKARTFPGRQVKAASCPECASKSCPECGKKTHFKRQPSIRWLVGVFAQKCRGAGPAGLFQLDPALPVDLTVDWCPACPQTEPLADRPRCLLPIFHSPPTPPPRQA